MARWILEEDVRSPTYRSAMYSLYLQISSLRKTIIAGTILIMAPLFILASWHAPSVLPETADVDWNKKAPAFILSGTLDYVQDTQMVWQIPPLAKAVLFIAHGCHGSATYFWDRSPKCADCVGLPEERIIVMHALSKGYAVLAITSTRECWSIDTDKDKVMAALSYWVEEKGLNKLPIVALGASSGGYFVSALANKYKFSSIVVMIAEGLFRTMKIDARYPSTLFVHMVKDKRRASLIRKAMELLKNRGIDTKEVKCYQLPVAPLYFTKIPGLTALMSKRIRQALKSSGILDDDNFMVADGRSMNWMAALKGRRTMPENQYQQWDMHMQELLNLAYGYHEMTSLQSDEIFEWLDAHLATGAG